jgi:hypothetical protein
MHASSQREAPVMPAAETSSTSSETADSGLRAAPTNARQDPVAAGAVHIGSAAAVTAMISRTAFAAVLWSIAAFDIV